MTAQQIMQLALEHHKAGRRGEAQASYRQVLAIDPANHVAMGMLGALLVELREPRQASDLFARAIQLAPTIPEYHNALGTAFSNQHRLAEAAAAFGQALQLRPNYADACYNLGRVCAQLGEADNAVKILIQAIALRPNFAEAHTELAVALRECGRFEQALASATRAIQINPNSHWGHNILGMIHAEIGQPNEAFACYRRAIGLRPNSAEAYLNMAHLRWRGGQLIEAIADLKRAAELSPTDSRPRHDLGVVLSDIAAHDEAIESLRAALTLRAASPGAHSALLLTMNYHPTLTPWQKFEEHLRWASQHARFSVKSPPRRTEPRRLRIGYVSADFCRHSVSWFIEPILARHNQQRFELFCYSDVLKPDHTTQRLRSLPIKWREITGVGHDRAAEIIANDQIDILVDLGGHTQRNRMLLFARKPAAIQVTYLGYPNTTGLSQVDYRFTDIYADPPGESDSLHTEKLIRLPHGFLCYQPPIDSPPVSPPPGIGENRPITFASFNVLAKLTPAAVAIWSSILKSVMRSRLILKNTSLLDPQVRKLIETSFTRYGVPPDRLDLHPPTATLTDHLSMYSGVDIALDTFPYNGTTTTCEALWMGVPVITQTGDTHAARVGSSILHQVGLPELVGTSPENYLRLAVELASDPARVAKMRLEMRDRLKQSSLLNPLRITADIESAYQTMAFTST